MSNDHITVQRIFDEAGYECRSYIGRGMYGDGCLAVTLNSATRIGTFIADVLYAAESIGDDDTITLLANAFNHMRSDNMGKGSVLYFPGVPFECDGDPDSVSDEDYYNGC